MLNREITVNRTIKDNESENDLIITNTIIILLKKMQAEYDNFISDIEKLSPSEIICKSYEIAMKEDILISVECAGLDNEDILALSSVENPLDTLYSDWLNRDYSYMDLLEDSIRDCTADLRKDI